MSNISLANDIELLKNDIILLKKENEKLLNMLNMLSDRSDLSSKSDNYSEITMCYIVEKKNNEVY